MEMKTQDGVSCMIDTDKYEGHTPAPWEASHDVLEHGHVVNNNGWRVYVGEHKRRAVIQNRTFMHDDLSEANAQLIADAPILLSEYKRLRGLLDKIDDVVYYYNEKDGQVLPVEKPNLELLRDIMMSYVDEAYQIRGDEGRWIE